MGAAIGKEAGAAGKGAADAAESAANHGLAGTTTKAGENAASHGAAKEEAKAASDATGSGAKTNTQGGRLQDKLPSGDTALKVGGAAYVANTVKDMGKNIDKQFGDIGEVVGGCEGKSGKDLEDCKKKGKAYVYIGFGVLLILMLR